ncbi:alpha/beta hydrolase [Candidatus Saccharibacteria bacterium]|nr:MAG: alpha/beta hydrolase [Candidatus Saccharibacteria bacterium]
MMFDYFLHGMLGRPYRLHAERSGDKTKPSIVLLHGIAASGDDWRKVLTYLESNYHCTTIDLLGFGKSPKPQWLGYTMEDHMRSLYHTMNKLHLRGQFLLIGHSLGSFLAARYATQHETNINRLLLLSPPVYPPLTQIKSKSARKLTGLLLNMYKFLRDDPRINPESFKRLSYIAPLPKSVIRNPDTWLPFMRTLKECIEKQTVLKDVQQLTIPVDVCYGTLDQVVVSSNVALLANNNNVRLHSFLNTHDLTTRYGKLVAKVLTQTIEPNT